MDEYKARRIMSEVKRFECEANVVWLLVWQHSNFFFWTAETYAGMLVINETTFI